MKNRFSYLLVAFLSTFFLSSCEDDSQPILATPTITNVEIGSGNNGVGVIGRDFHLNADIVAGGKIDFVQVRISPKIGEQYAYPWSFELTWEHFKGAKNANVHQHFDIPEDAVEGMYDFILVVADENGTRLEETYTFEIVDAADLAVDPLLYLWMITTDHGDFHYVNETLVSPENVRFSKGEVLRSDVTIKNVKGDGKVYLLLVKKELNHRPESVDAIDFSKVIVYDVFEHQNEEKVYAFGNAIYDGQGGYLRQAPEFVIGASSDNNTPQSHPLIAEKAWESGAYYFGVVYTNSTYNMNLYHYFELDVSGF